MSFSIKVGLFVMLLAVSSANCESKAGNRLLKASDYVYLATRITKIVLYGAQDMDSTLEAKITTELSRILNDLGLLMRQYENIRAHSNGTMSGLKMLQILPRALAFYERTHRFLTGSHFAEFRNFISIVNQNARELIDAEIRQANDSHTDNTVNVTTTLSFLRKFTTFPKAKSTIFSLAKMIG